jgi:hypothetical protein
VAARYESSLERLGKVVASALQEALQEESVVIVVRRDPAPKSRPNQCLLPANLHWCGDTAFHTDLKLSALVLLSNTYCCRTGAACQAGQVYGG